MKRVFYDDMKAAFERVLVALLMSKDKAHRCSEIFANNSLDGVISHGLNRFPDFVETCKQGVVNINAEAACVNALGAIEQWDGHLGIGPLNAERAMARAVELAKASGMGCVAMRHTNHWMRAGAYGLQAADSGCIGMCWTNTIALMPAWGGVEKRIGNNPFVLCVPKESGHVLLDMAMTQYSFGKLDVFQRLGESLPYPGGFDSEGALCADPDQILASGRPLPIGYWKGTGLAMMLDLVAMILSGGDATKDVSARAGETGVSQVFLAIDAKRFAAQGYEEKVEAVIDQIQASTPLQTGQSVRYPGQGMLATRRENLQKGIPVDESIWQQVLALA